MREGEKVLTVCPLNLQEDSGGPLVCKIAAGGIVSYGKTDGSAPQVFKRVLSFLSWINYEKQLITRCNMDHFLTNHLPYS